MAKSLKRARLASSTATKAFKNNRISSIGATVIGATVFGDTVFDDAVFEATVHPLKSSTASRQG
jgi:hypothetical protein